ncbi:MULTISPECIES: hypothetical protein [Arsenophonus]|uniref:hypothetical protein n=1 Tax=Arsenophonus TaxID=637 RepID=UPI0038796FF3
MKYLIFVFFLFSFSSSASDSYVCPKGTFPGGYGGKDCYDKDGNYVTKATYNPFGGLHFPG